MSRDVLLLSIRSEHADKIFCRRKSVELRRRRPRVKPGDVVLVYVPAPVKAIVGTFEVDGVVADSPHELWDKVQHDVAVPRELFDRYYEGATTGFGIVLKKAQYFSKPLRLDRIREQWLDFQPPQGYRYLTPKQMRVLQGMQP